MMTSGAVGWVNTFLSLSLVSCAAANVVEARSALEGVDCVKGFERRIIGDEVNCYRFIEFDVKDLQASGMTELEFVDTLCMDSAKDKPLPLLPRMVSVHSSEELKYLSQLFLLSLRDAESRKLRCADDFPIALTATSTSVGNHKRSFEWADGSREVAFATAALATSARESLYSNPCYYASPSRGLYANLCIRDRAVAVRPKCQLVACKYKLVQNSERISNKDTLDDSGMTDTLRDSPVRNAAGEPLSEARKPADSKTSKVDAPSVLRSTNKSEAIGGSIPAVERRPKSAATAVSFASKKLLAEAVERALARVENEAAEEDLDDSDEDEDSAANLGGSFAKRQLQESARDIGPPSARVPALKAAVYPTDPSKTEPRSSATVAPSGEGPPRASGSGAMHPSLVGMLVGYFFI